MYTFFCHSTPSPPLPLFPPLLNVFPTSLLFPPLSLPPPSRFFPGPFFPLLGPHPVPAHPFLPSVALLCFSRAASSLLPCPPPPFSLLFSPPLRPLSRSLSFPRSRHSRAFFPISVFSYLPAALHGWSGRPPVLFMFLLYFARSPSLTFLF